MNKYYFHHNLYITSLKQENHRMKALSELRQSAQTITKFFSWVTKLSKIFRSNSSMVMSHKCKMQHHELSTAVSNRSHTQVPPLLWCFIVIALERKWRLSENQNSETIQLHQGYSAFSAVDFSKRAGRSSCKRCMNARWSFKN